MAHMLWRVMQTFRVVFGETGDLETKCWTSSEFTSFMACRPKKRYEVPPNVCAVVNRRGFSELTQHFPFPILRELRERGSRPRAVRDSVDVFDPLV